MTPASAWFDVRAALSERWLKLTEGLPRAFWGLVIGTFITRFGTFIVPLLFAYLTQFRHLSLTTGGQVAALYGVGSFIGSMAGGALADHLGRRATMLGALVSSAIFMVALGSVEQVWLLGSMTFLVGLTGDAFRPASQALVADVVSAEHRLKAFSIQYWAINLGFTFAALIGGYMASRNFTVLFIADAATTLMLALIIYRMVPESRPAPSREAKPGSFITPFADARFATFLVLNFLISVVFFQHLTGLLEDMRQKGLTTADFGFAIATNGLLIVMIQPAVTARVRHVPYAKLLAVASVLTGAGFGLTTFAHSLAMYVVTVVVWTMGEILFSPANAAIVAEAAPAHLRGRYQGAYMLTWSLAAVASPVVGPFAMEHFGMGPYWFACFALGMVAAVGHLAVTSRVLR